MNIILIDRDEASSNAIAMRIKGMGFDLVAESSREVALQMVANQNFGIILIDPAPLADPKQALMALRSASRTYPYIIMMGHDVPDSFMSVSANAFLEKPVDPAELEARILDATQLEALRSKLANTSTDYPSEGGIISKSAFNQIFLSCVDRGDRYGEATYCLFLRVDNYKQLLASDEAAARLAAARLAHELSAIRRQSDILGQIDDAEFAVLFLRVSTGSEPEEATARFIESLSRLKGFKDNPQTDVILNLRLLELTTGQILINKTFQVY